MMAVARESVVLADHDKWGRVAFASFGTIDEVSAIFTDSGAAEDLVNAVRAKGVNVISV